MIQLFKGDCLELLKNIPDGSVDLILTDPPYGNMKGAELDGWDKNKTLWDDVIDPAFIFSEAKRILRKNGKLILFSQEPYSSDLIIKAIPAVPFNYRMVWEKDHFANALLSKKAPVSYFEDILVFTKDNPKHDNTGENPVREYLVSEKIKTKMTNKDFNVLFSEYTGKKGCKDRSVIEHYWGKAQFTFPTEEIYVNILQKTGFFKKDYSEIFGMGKPYRDKINESLAKKYPATFNLPAGQKYKSNILKYKKDYNGFHPTQKPVALMEDLIKTYTNVNDKVLDFTMGSGSTGVAAVNLGRDFIGIERDDKYFSIAEKRISEAEQNSLF